MSFRIRIIILLVCILPALQVRPQGGFVFGSNDRKVAIPFRYINNLIFIPVRINDVELTFLLDTGVDETILFSLEGSHQINFNDVKKIKLIGLGGAETVEGLKSSNNSVTIKGMTDKNHDIFIVLDQGFNFSANIGIPVNGIIGYHFFRNFPVEIDYDKRKVVVYRDTTGIFRRVRKKFARYPITIEKHKPYTVTEVDIEEDLIDAKLLIDLGSSDALWLFPDKSDRIKVPLKNFDDFLGRGLSGDIHGKRARIDQMKFFDYDFKNLLAAFPESGSTKNIDMVENRVGSLGSEILRRFKVVFDYRNKQIYLRKSRTFYDPFQYNMSGIEIHHEGMIWVREEMQMVTVKQGSAFDRITDDAAEPFRYKFELKPVYVVTNIRKGSPGEIAGLKKGDILHAVNGRSAYRFSLQEINKILKSEEGKIVEIQVDRGGQLIRFRFVLKSVI